MKKKKIKKLKKQLKNAVFDNTNAEINRLKKMLYDTTGKARKYSGAYIDAGIGRIGYSCDNIDLQELMEQLNNCIKTHGVRNVISILAKG